jgi:pimeloyl-ACP methyl ester carboxylesterase
MAGRAAEVSGMDRQRTTILLIHGLWLTSKVWENWVLRYTTVGYQALAADWPGMTADVHALRADPSTMDGVGLAEVADHYEKIIRELPATPIIMGHAVGGVLVQMLLDRGLGRAGVAIGSAPVKGVFGLPWSSLRAGFPILRNPANRKRTVGLTARQWRYAFANTLTREQSQAAYDRYCVPASGRPLWQSVLANFTTNPATKVDPRKDDRAPLLFIAGGEDRTAPASLNEANLRLYRNSNAMTDYRIFPGRPHFSIGAPGWEEVADYALAWASSRGVARYPGEAAS